MKALRAQPTAASPRPCPSTPRPRRSRLALAALCLLGGGGRAQAQDWTDLRFQEFYGELELRLELSDEDRATQTSSRSQKEILTREILTLGTVGYYYHPRLVEFDLRGSLGFEQQDISTDGSTGDQRNDATFPNWDLRARLFKEHANSGKLYSIRNETWARQSFFPTVRTTVTETGSSVHAKELLVPSRLHYHHYTFDSNGASAQDQVRDNFTLTGALLESEQQFSYGLEYNDVRQSKQNLSYEDYSGNVRSTIFVGDDRDLRWNNFARVRVQQGNVDVDTLAGSSQLYKRWGPSLNGDLGLQYTRTESGTAFNETTTATTAITHNLYDSLTSSANAQLGQTRLEGGNIDLVGTGGQLAYQKITPLGRLGLRYDADFYIQDQDDLQGNVPIFDETHLFTLGVPLFLGNHSVDPASVLITDATGLTTYTEGLDYFLTAVGTQLRVDIPVGSLITPGDTILVDYVFSPNPEIEFSNLAQTSVFTFNFHHLADLTVSYSQVNQDLISGVDTGILTDSTRTAANFSVYPYDATLGVQYENYDSDFAPYERTSLLASYQRTILSRTMMRLNANTFKTRFADVAEEERGTSASVSFISGAGRSTIFHLTGDWRSIENVSDEGTGVGLEVGWQRDFRALRVALDIRYTDEEFEIATDQRILALFFTVTRRF